MPASDPILDTASPAFTRALDAVRGDLARIPAEELAPVTLDLRAAVVTVLGALPEIRRHRPALAALCGEAQAREVDRLETVAQAAAQAHALALLGTGESTGPLSEAVVEARTGLLTDAQALVNRKLLEPSALGGLRGIVGFKSQCFDVLQLVALFRGSWEAVKAHTPVVLADLDRAEALANRLAMADGHRARAEAGTTAAADLRNRAFKHLLDTYDEVRRMVTYLRWRAGDADRIAPSLWAGRRGRRKARAAEPTMSPTDGTTAAATLGELAPAPGELAPAVPLSSEPGGPFTTA